VYGEARLSLAVLLLVLVQVRVFLFHVVTVVSLLPSVALTLLVWHQKEHLACKKMSDEVLS